MLSNILPGVISALVVTLPLLFIWICNERVTTAFREGLNSIHIKNDTKTEFRPAPVYFVMCFFLVIGISAIAIRFFIIESPLYALGIICLLPAMMFVFILIVLFNSKLLIRDKRLTYHSGVSKSVIEFSQVVDVSAAAGLLIFSLHNMKKKAIPLMFSDVRSLGQAIRKELYEK
jgi:hypothetical protein